MAETGSSSSGGKGIGKVFQKTVIRTREKMMQNLGKADKTRDDELEQHILLFNEQQATAVRLQKELRHYINCVKEMSLASQSMYKSVKETYEPSWSGYTETVSSAELLSNLWEDYLSKLNDQLHSPLTAYNAHFPEMKAKVAKRGRKLTDYDSARHNHEASLNSKKPDDSKITKTLDELNEAKHIYEVINTELHEELPTLHQSRVTFLSSYFNSLFAAEAVFHRECAKLKDVMADMSGKLHDEAERSGVPTVFRAKSMKADVTERNDHSRPTVATTSNRESIEFNRVESNMSTKNTNVQIKSSPVGEKPPTFTAATRPDLPPTSPTSPTSPKGPPVGAGESRNRLSEGGPLYVNGMELSMNRDSEGAAGYEVPNNALLAVARGQSVDTSNHSNANNSEVKDDVEASSPTDAAHTVYSLAKDPEEPYIIPSSNAQAAEDTAANSRILFKVISTHRYQGDDVDELSFEPNEVICVVPFDDPEEQDEGWLMGYKEASKEKGVFPENFTKRL